MNDRPIYAGIGSRETPDQTLRLMTRIATRLEQRGWLLHSGGADGADQAFELGISDLSNARIFLPWPKFRFEERRRVGLRNGEFEEPSQYAYEIAQEFHPAWNRLKQGGRLCMARNGYQVLGQSLNNPVNCVVCWTRDGKASGGTGQALRIAAAHHIPIFNLYYSAALNDLGNFVQSLDRL